MFRPRLITLFTLPFIASCALGSEDNNRRATIELNNDGTVVVGDMTYDSMTDYHRSAEFRLSNRRCATHEPEIIPEAASDCSYSSTTIKGEYNPGDVLRIPVVFHVVKRTDGTGDITEALLRSQIDVLNEDFNPTPAQQSNVRALGGIEFFLATEDPDGNPTTGINYHTNNAWFVDPGSGTSPMKAALAWDTTRYFNIYTNDANGALGYATFPSTTAGETQDGVVLLWSAVGRNAPEGGAFNLGRTATHEVGHYLGLFHTFQDGCGTGYSAGDRIADTVAESEPNFDCVPQASSCVSGRQDPIENFMDYSEDRCLDRFSPEQVNRMRCSVLHFRQDLYTIGGTPGGNQYPVAAFTFTTNGSVVSFTNNSQDADGTIASVAWNFGDGTSSTQSAPTHTYASPGTYSVTLAVTDDDGATRSTSQSVTIADPNQALVVSVPRNNLSASVGGQIEYYFDLNQASSQLTFRMSGGTGDADMHVRFGQPATTSAYDHRPYETGNDETVNITNPAQGRYYVMINAYSAFSGASLEVTLATPYDTGNAIVLTPGTSVTNIAVARGGQLQYALTVPSSARTLTVRISGGRGDADLYVRRGTGAPTLETYDYRPYLNGNAESVRVTASPGGQWRIMLNAYSAISGVTLVATVE